MIVNDSGVEFHHVHGDAQAIVLPGERGDGAEGCKKECPA